MGCSESKTANNDDRASTPSVADAKGSPFERSGKGAPFPEEVYEEIKDILKSIPETAEEGDEAAESAQEGDIEEAVDKIKGILCQALSFNRKCTINSSLTKDTTLVTEAVNTRNIYFLKAVLRVFGPAIDPDIIPGGTFAKPPIVDHAKKAKNPRCFKAMFKLLVDAGADPNNTKGFADTHCLEHLVGNSWMEDDDDDIADCVAFAIKECGADPNKAIIKSLSLNRKDGFIQLTDASVLHLAAANQLPLTACALLDNGADARQRCYHDCRPADTLAKVSDADPKFIELLKIFADDGEEDKHAETALETWKSLKAE